MGVLSAQQVLKDKQTHDSNSITSLSLTQKALSDVSCLSEFNNLERLDLAFNNLNSLEGLRSCLNLKWLSVVQNKLQSLIGIESLSNLTVLNAGKNKLKSIEEIKPLVSLRALILNDNEIVSICRLDQMKELNTLVLSRNPIREIGDSLVKVKSLKKLSLSNCQLQTIGSSLKSCIELKELRLAHNEIKSLPAELANNKKLQNLDLGNNVITSWSDVKVLNSLVDLKNLNLQGNPITDNDKLAKKIQKLLPNLHIYNARPINKDTKNGNGGRADRVDDISLIANKAELHGEKKKNYTRNKESSKHEMGQSISDHVDDASDPDVTNLKLERKNTKRRLSENAKVDVFYKDDNIVEKERKRKKSNEKDAEDLGMKKDLKRKSVKTDEKFLKKNVPAHKDDTFTLEKKPKTEKPRGKQDELDIIDNGEASFADLFAIDAAESPKHSGGKKELDKAVEERNSLGGLVTFSAKKKKTKNRGVSVTVKLSTGVEVGMGGPSTWDDE